MKKTMNIKRTIEDNSMLIIAWVALIFFCIESFVVDDMLLAVMFTVVLWGSLNLHVLNRIERKVDKYNTIDERIRDCSFDSFVAKWDGMED